MRLFLAVLPPQRIRREVALAVADFARRGFGRFVSELNLHLSLQFLGETPSDAVPAIQEATESCLRRPFIDLEWGGMGVFPKFARARVAYLKVRSEADQLLSGEGAEGESPARAPGQTGAGGPTPLPRPSHPGQIQAASRALGPGGTRAGIGAALLAQHPRRSRSGTERSDAAGGAPHGTLRASTEGLNLRRPAALRPAVTRATVPLAASIRATPRARSLFDQSSREMYIQLPPGREIHG